MPASLRRRPIPRRHLRTASVFPAVQPRYFASTDKFAARANFPSNEPVPSDKQDRCADAWLAAPAFPPPTHSARRAAPVRDHQLEAPPGSSNPKAPPTRASCENAPAPAAPRPLQCTKSPGQLRRPEGSSARRRAPRTPHRSGSPHTRSSNPPTRCLVAYRFPQTVPEGYQSPRLSPLFASPLLPRRNPAVCESHS